MSPSGGVSRPTARANARPAPLMIAGARVGSTTSRNVVAFEAPSEDAARSSRGSKVPSALDTDTTTKGVAIAACAST